MRPCSTPAIMGDAQAPASARNRIAAMSVTVLVAALMLLPSSARAACPCYTLSSSSNTYNCGIEAIVGTNPTTAEWQSIFAVISSGPNAWGSNGPPIADIGSGCGNPQATTQVPAKFPCELVKAIAMQESGWRQFCAPTTPADEAGKSSRTIISFDCGYGVGQVTSGMHTGETPSFNRTRVASEPTYNMATGASILAGKWRATNCVGDNQPTIIEDWYTAVWAYNGLSYSNNPNNPSFSANRGVWNPSVGGSAPYQEKVLGWMEFPSSTTYWTSTKVAYPALSAIGTGSSPPDLPEPNCNSPTTCANTRSVHVSSCLKPDAGVPDAGTADAGTKTDGGTKADGGTRNDAGVPDAGEVDAGEPIALDSIGGGSGVENLSSADSGGCHCSSVDPLVLVPGIAALWIARRRRR
ncbi:MAG: hypothetical protein ACJ790_12650 [Myxococcaceae bacterium]